MPKLIKSKDQIIPEKVIASLVGKFVDVSENPLPETNKITGEVGLVNGWFGGFVAGYQKTIVGLNLVEQVMFPEPVTHFHILVSDGVMYVLSPKAVIHELTEEEFKKKCEEVNAKQKIIKQGIALPGRDF